MSPVAVIWHESFAVRTRIDVPHCQACGLTDAEEVDPSTNDGYSTCCNELIVSTCWFGEDDGCSHDVHSLQARDSRWLTSTQLRAAAGY